MLWQHCIKISKSINYFVFKLGSILNVMIKNAVHKTSRKNARVFHFFPTNIIPCGSREKWSPIIDAKFADNLKRNQIKIVKL